MISLTGSGSANAAPQWISFVEGSASVAPQESAFPTHVLSADTNLNNIDGGDATDGFSEWVTDLLVYPSSEYWETLLSNNRVRPYVDLSISDYNTVRIPSSIHDYDLYADTGKFYENVVVDGTFTVGSVLNTDTTDLNVTNDINVANDANVTGTVTAETLKGYANTRIPISEKTASFTFDTAESGYIYQCSPAGAEIEITLPVGLDASSKGITFTVNNLLAGKTVKFINLSNARGTILGEQYSSCTIYWDGSAWYGIGDLV